jgi:CBS domain-containing protein
MEQPVASVTEETPLSEAVSLMKKLDTGFLPVIKGGGKGELVGMIEQKEIQRAISHEILRRRRVAEEHLDKPVRT